MTPILISLIPSPDGPDLDLGQELVSGFAGRRIREQALRLVRTAVFTSSDVPDIQQDLAISIIRALPEFNPQRGHWKVFVRTVLKRSALTLLRSRWRLKRRLPRQTVSLEAPCGAPNGQLTSIGSLVELRHVSAISGRGESSPWDAIDQHEGLDIAIRSLPPDLRHLCYWLQFESPSQVSRQICISRTTLYKKIKTICKLVKQFGFDDSIQKKRTASA